MKKEKMKSNNSRLGAKTPKNSTLLAKSTKIVRDLDKPSSPWLEEYRDCFTFQFQPVTEAFIDRISTQLIEWARSDNDALRISDFHYKKGIPAPTYYRWCKNHEQLQLAHDTALNFIASRREIGAITRKYDSGMISQSMPMYDPMWKDFMEWKSKLKALEQEKQSVKIEISDLSKKVEITEG